MGGMFRVALFTLGSPWRVYPSVFAWSEVEYVVSPPDGGNPVSFSSRSTFPVICEAYRPDYLVFLVQDTVVYEPGVRDYRDLREHIESLFREFVCELGEKCVGGKFDVVVLPGTGMFSCERRDRLRLSLDYCGSMSDFYYIAYLRLAEILLGKLKEALERRGGGLSLEVILDVTHGINYMPTLTYRAVKDILARIAILTNTGILHSLKFRMLNSEPVTDATSPKFIHIVEETHVKPDTSLTLHFDSGYKAKLLSLTGKCVSGEADIRVLGKAIEEKSKCLLDMFGGTLRNLAIFASSITHGLPLLTLYTKPKVSLREFVERLINNFESFIDVKVTWRQGNVEIRLRRMARIERVVEDIARILIVAELLKINRR